MSRKVIAKQSYPKGYDFTIALCNIGISYVENRYIKQIRNNPKLLLKYEKQLEPTEGLMKLDKNNLIPGQDVHDRKLQHLITMLDIPRSKSNTYWINSVEPIRVLSRTKQRN